nr:hypothetical protein [Streptomyces sp. HNM0574]
MLTRLHVPAGKAIAIAAMPSAVLMGMGLTPQLANAKPLPKNPFKPGPCVSQQDQDAQEQEEKAERAAKEKAEREKAEKKKAAEEKAEREKAEREKAEEDGSGSDSSGDSGSDSGADSGSGDSTEPSDGSSDTDESGKNPLDPLGLGDKIKDAFTPDDQERVEEARQNAAEQDKSGSDAAGSDTAQDSGTAEADSGAKPDVGGALEDTVGKVGDGVEDTTGKLEQGAEDAKDKLGDVKFPSTKEEAQDAADGKTAMPCVEEKKSEGKDEQTAATLPNDPWQLDASSLALHGLDYKGVVNVKTASGQTKQVLKFTADSLDIGDLHQTVKGPDGTTYHVQAAKGSKSTIRGGQVTMYTERLEGNLFGLIPIVFDPEHPPPLNVPEAYFTKVKVTQAGQFGGNLTVPGLHQFVD